jgi:hypothetical protein
LTSRPRDREQACLLQEEIGLMQLILPAEEARGGNRQVRVSDRLERREGGVSQLVKRDRIGDVFQAMRAQGGELSLEELDGCLRDDDLATVGAGADSGCEMDVVSDVALLGEVGRPRVDADPHADIRGRETRGE